MTGPSQPIIDVTDLVKVYGGKRADDTVRAVDGITFNVAQGEFFGFLGPNGAGKTTTIRMLATLLRPTEGRALVDGNDVVAEPAIVRRRVGFAMQTVAVDIMGTGRENLELIGRLHRVPAPDLRRRVDELLEVMGLTEVAGKLAGTYSGGMKRRLDLATALVHRPTVLFLDEPTEGLDPQSRTALWQELLKVRVSGTTMFLTTHYLEEADHLCDRLAIIDHGRIAVEGSPAELKRGIGSDQVSLTLAGDASDGLVAAQESVAHLLDGFEPLTSLERTPVGVNLAVRDAHAAIPEVLRRLDADGVRVAGLSMTEPTLDDVFLRYTGTRIRQEAADQTIELGW
jgi:ABC-2 type transport system ATP-binding protein